MSLHNSKLFYRLTLHERKKKVFNSVRSVHIHRHLASDRRIKLFRCSSLKTCEKNSTKFAASPYILIRFEGNFLDIVTHPIKIHIAFSDRTPFTPLFLDRLNKMTSEGRIFSRVDDLLSGMTVFELILCFSNGTICFF